MAFSLGRLLSAGAQARGAYLQGQDQRRTSDEARQRQAALDAFAQETGTLRNQIAQMDARDQFGLVDPRQAQAESALGGMVADTAPQLGDPMMAGMAQVQGLLRKRQLDTAPRVALGGDTFVQDPTQTRFAREEGAKARERQAIAEDQQAARREMAAAQQAAAREAQTAALAAAKERGDADRASREAIAREGNATRGAIAAAAQGRAGGRQFRPTEQMVRARAFAPSMQTAVEKILAIPDEKFEVDLKSALLSKVGMAGNYFKSEDYQRLENNLAGVLASVLPIVSGQAITPSEAVMQSRTLLPAPGDSKAVRDDKRQRLVELRDAVQRIASGGGAAPAAPSAPAGEDDLDPQVRAFMMQHPRRP